MVLPFLCLHFSNFLQWFYLISFFILTKNSLESVRIGSEAWIGASKQQDIWSIWGPFVDPSCPSAEFLFTKIHAMDPNPFCYFASDCKKDKIGNKVHGGREKVKWTKSVAEFFENLIQVTTGCPGI